MGNTFLKAIQYVIYVIRFRNGSYIVIILFFSPASVDVSVLATLWLILLSVFSSISVYSRRAPLAPVAVTWQTSTSAPSFCSSSSQICCFWDSRSLGPFTSTSCNNMRVSLHSKFSASVWHLMINGKKGKITTRCDYQRSRDLTL